MIDCQSYVNNAVFNLPIINSVGKEDMQDHLDMYFRQNRKANQDRGPGHGRSWFEVRNIFSALSLAIASGLDTEHRIRRQGEGSSRWSTPDECEGCCGC